MLDYVLRHDGEVREKYPEAYALTTREANFVARAESVFFEAAHGFSGLSDEDLQKPDMKNKITESVFDSFKRKRINPDRLIKLADRIERGKYWSYALVKIDEAQSSSPISTYMTDSNIPGIVEQFNTTLEAFFSTDNPRERARLLNVPEDGLYIPSYELFILRQLRDFCKVGKINPKASADFWRLKSSPSINALSEIGSAALLNKRLDEDSFEDKYKLTAANGVPLSLAVDYYEEAEILLKTPNADKLLMQFINKAIEQGLKDKTVVLTLNEVMEVRGLTDRKTAAHYLRAATRFLLGVSVGIDDKKTGVFDLQRIAKRARFESGKGKTTQSIITFDDDFFKELETATGFMQYPTKLQMIPNNKGNAYVFAKAFATQKRRNIGKPNDIENKLSVVKLLAKSTLPLYDTLKDKGQASQLIIKPFVEALDYLEQDEQLFSYQFQYKKNGSNPVELTDADTYNLFSNYAIFSSLVIKVAWKDEPDYTHLLERKQAQRERAKKNKGKGNKPIKK